MLWPRSARSTRALYLARDVTLLHSRAVGAERNHFSCALSNGRNTVAGIMFHCTDIEALMHTDSVVNAAFEVQIDEWRGRRSVKAMLQSLAPARTCVRPGGVPRPRRTSASWPTCTPRSDAELCADAPHNPEDIEAYEASREAQPRRVGGHGARRTRGASRSDIVRAIIGDGSAPRRPQRDRARTDLAAGRSVLGRHGHGARQVADLFQVHAARCARCARPRRPACSCTRCAR